MLRLKVALSDATVATSSSTDSSADDRQPSPGITQLTHMGMHTPGWTTTSTTSIDTRKACQRYSWRAVKLSNNCVTNLRMEFENSDISTAQLKAYTARLADTLRRTTPVLRAIQHVAESDNVARAATAHLGDGCKTTERLPLPIPARLPTRLHLYDEEESAPSNASTPKKAITTGDDGIVLKLAWSPTGEEVTIAIARGASLQRQLVPVLEGE